MPKTLTALQYFIIGVSIAFCMLSAFYLGRMTKPVVEVCALGRTIAEPKQ